MNLAQHYHRCASPTCEVSWICQRLDCPYESLCDACERKQFEAFADRQGWTVAQPVLPEFN